MFLNTYDENVSVAGSHRHLLPICMLCSFSCPMCVTTTILYLGTRRAFTRALITCKREAWLDSNGELASQGMLSDWVFWDAAVRALSPCNIPDGNLWNAAIWNIYSTLPQPHEQVDACRWCHLTKKTQKIPSAKAVTSFCSTTGMWARMWSEELGYLSAILPLHRSPSPTHTHTYLLSTGGKGTWGSTAFSMPTSPPGPYQLKN